MKIVFVPPMVQYTVQSLRGEEILDLLWVSSERRYKLLPGNLLKRDLNSEGNAFAIMFLEFHPRIHLSF